MADILNKLNSANYITVKVTDNAIVNGNNLLAAYSLAKSTNPNGTAKSATNRLDIILPVAIYDLGTQSLTLDTEYIDIIGSTTDRNNHYIKSNVGAAPSTGTVRQTANNVKLINLTIENTNTSYSGANHDTKPTAYFPDSDLPLVYIENVTFSANDNHVYSMRLGITYSGKYINCTGGIYSFGGSGDNGGTLSGTFTNCTSGNFSFGGGGINGGTLSGTFQDCTGGEYSFGGNGGNLTSTSKFTNCTGANFSFGGSNNVGGTLSGTFTNCTGKDISFGGGGTGGTLEGTFKDCTGRNFSFGGGIGNGGNLTSTSVFTNCTGGNYSFGGGGTGGTLSGTFKDCKGGSSSFGNL